MKITYYGTAAAEGWPGIFCECEMCQGARSRGGRNIRTRSQALINDDLLLDLPPDTYLHCLNYGLDMNRVNALLFTHSHLDHCCAETLDLLRDPFSRTRSRTLEVFGNGAVADKILRACSTLGNDSARFVYATVENNIPFETIGYTVTPLRATHAKNERCLFYHIAQGNKSVLYAHDTGALTDENMECLSKRPGKLSLVSLDCTTQKFRDGANHMGLEDAAEQKERLLKAGFADADTVWVVNHFSHNGGLLHEELCEVAGKLGFLASYDGMSIEF